MYHIREDIKDIYNKSAIAKIVSRDVATIVRIFKGKQNCSKVTAYAITKTICSSAEIEDFFERIK